MLCYYLDVLGVWGGVGSVVFVDEGCWVVVGLFGGWVG